MSDLSSIASAPAFSVGNVVVTIIITAIILGVTYATYFVFNRIVTRTLGRKNRSAAYEVGRIGSIVIWVAGVLAVLPILGASDIVVAVVILLVGAFLILATRDFTNNWFAGQMIRTLAPFRVGDWIRTAGGSYGRVAKIETLYTMLVTPQNETVVIPNSKLTSDLILDRSTSGSLKVPVDLELSHDMEFGQLTSAVTKITKELSSYLVETDNGKKAEPEIYVVSRSPDYVKIRVFLRIENAAKEEEAASEFRKRFSMMGLDRPVSPVAERRGIEP